MNNGPVEQPKMDDRLRQIVSRKVAEALTSKPGLCRAGRGLLKDFVEKYDLAKNTAAKILAGETLPSLALLTEIARDAGKPLDWFISEHFDPPPVGGQGFVPILGRPGEFVSMPKDWSLASIMAPAEDLVAVLRKSDETAGGIGLGDCLIVQRLSFTQPCRRAIIMMQSADYRPFVYDLHQSADYENLFLVPLEGGRAEMIKRTSIAVSPGLLVEPTGELFLLGRLVGWLSMNSLSLDRVFAPEN